MNLPFDKLNDILGIKKINDFKNYIDPWEALKEGIRLAEKDDLIVVTGSSYLVGELRKFWFDESVILSSGDPFSKKNRKMK